MDDLERALPQALEACKPSILALAGDLMAIPTENPPGRAYPECVERIRAELDLVGLDHRLIEAPGEAGLPRFNLLAFHGDGSRTLCLHGHYDVVPAQSSAQFNPRVEGGWLIGRGSADMKAGIAAMVYAAHLLKQLNAPLRGRVGLCIVADEETGGRGGSGYLDELGLLGRDAVAMLTPEPTGGVVWNANRGAITLRVTVKGRAAHVGLQHQGINAFEQMLRVASALQGLKADVERRRTSYRIGPDAAANSILMLGGRVEGGTNFNVVPESCSFTLDRRFNPEEDTETEKARLFAVLEKLRGEGIDLSVETLQEGCSSGVPEDDPTGQILAETIKAVAGEPARFEMCPGLLETRWYARKGIPAFAYGPGRLDLAHGPDEAVEIERIWQCTLACAVFACRLLS
ncbi:MAG: ArgE/DapE family deacylase [Acidobacteriota bacterium]